jgi:hypothetical protein
MRALRLAAIALLTVFSLSACSTLSVTTDYDRTVDFSKLKTFRFEQQTEIRNQLVYDRVIRAITTELEAKGLSRADADADLVVAVHGRVDNQTQVRTDSFGYGWGRWGYWGGGPHGYGGSTTTVSQVPVGTLVVDLVDARAKQLVWQAVAEDTIRQSASPDERDARVSEAMKRVFADFPPTGR